MTRTLPDPADSCGDPSAPAAGDSLEAEPRSPQLLGFRIAVTSDQRNGDLVAALERRGAQVIQASALHLAPAAEDETRVANTRALPADGDRLRRLIEAVCSRNVDLVTFTSAPAVNALFSTAGELACADELLAALRTGVVAAAIGPVRRSPSSRPASRPSSPSSTVCAP